MFKDLAPAALHTKFPEFNGMWYVQTLDGTGYLPIDGSGVLVTSWIDISYYGGEPVMFDTEIDAVVAAWDYYFENKEDFPDDQRARWLNLFSRGSDAEPLENKDPTESQVMDFG